MSNTWSLVWVSLNWNLFVGVFTYQPGYPACKKSHKRCYRISHYDQFNPIPVRWCWRSEVTAAKVASMLWLCHCYIIPCVNIRIWSSFNGRQVNKHFYLAWLGIMIDSWNHLEIVYHYLATFEKYLKEYFYAWKSFGLLRIQNAS